MGFDLQYSTTEQISPALQREIIADARLLDSRHSWVQCDGPSVENDDGLLIGWSRVSPADPDGIAEARDSGLPVGRLPELLAALCELSGRHGIDWEVSHDHSDGIVGLIQYVVADDSVRDTIDGLNAMLEMENGMSFDDFDEPFE